MDKTERLAAFQRDGFTILNGSILKNRPLRGV